MATHECPSNIPDRRNRNDQCVDRDASIRRAANGSSGEHLHAESVLMTIEPCGMVQIVIPSDLAPPSDERVVLAVVGFMLESSSGS
jgi:hypothetical protein